MPTTVIPAQHIEPPTAMEVRLVKCSHKNDERWQFAVSFLVLVSWQCLTPNEYRHIDAQVKIPLVSSGTSSEWEIDSRLLTLDHQLGHGQFGCVTLMTRRVMCQKSSHLATAARVTHATVRTQPPRSGCGACAARAMALMRSIMRRAKSVLPGALEE